MQHFFLNESDVILIFFTIVVFQDKISFYWIAVYQITEIMETKSTSPTVLCLQKCIIH